MKIDKDLLLDRMPVGIFILRLEDRKTKEFRNVYINKTNSEIVGTDLQLFIGKTLRESFPDAYKHGFPEKYLEALDTQKKVKIGEVQYGDSNVNQQTFFLEVLPLDTKTVMLTTENISNLRKTQEELLLKNKSLKNKNKEIEQLNYIVSHDLKSPLRTISGFLRILKKKYKLNDSKEVQFIEESTKRMNILIEEILDFSMIGKNKKLIEINCNTLLKEVKADLNELIKESRAKLTIAKLPTIIGYKTELRQLFQNLISNAIKFTRPGINPIIYINAKTENKKWQFSIQDNGAGINKKFFTKVFEPFQRFSHKSDCVGSGIGLATCKKIVDLHNGAIWVESELNKGSTFFFTINNKFK